MLHHRLLYVVLWALMATGIPSPPRSANAQSADSTTRLEQRLHEREQQRDALARDGQINLLLSALVIGAGAAASAVQLLSRKGGRVATGLCGVAASALTALNSIAYPIGWREIYTRTARCQTALSQAKDDLVTLAGLALEDGARSSKQDRVFSSLKRCDNALSGLEDTNALTAGPASPLAASAVWGLAAKAWAAEARPSWIDKAPSDDAALYLVALGQGDSSATARSDAIRLARQEIERTVLDRIVGTGNVGLPQDSQLTRDIVGVAGIVDTFSERTDVNDRPLYRYYALVRILRRDIEDGLARYEADSGARVTKKVEKALLSESGDAYYNRRFQAYASALDLARTTLSTSDYEALLKGRELRKADRFDEAAALLGPAVRQEPGWYLGWYNLAMSYAKIGRYDDAKRSYDVATQLEPALELRDPSIYNSFGHFLYERGELEGAAKLLTTALELDPGLTGARYTLAMIKKDKSDGNTRM